MNLNTFPTKGNLILAKNSLALAKQGYELMDKKRNILIRELMELIDKASSIQSEIDSTYTAAYAALQQANIQLGISTVQDIASSVAPEESITIKTRSIMGTEIPLVGYTPQASSKPAYAFYGTKESLDVARQRFERGDQCLSPGKKKKKDTEACQCAEEYHNPHLRSIGKIHYQCAGGKGS